MRTSYTVNKYKIKKVIQLCDVRSRSRCCCLGDQCQVTGNHLSLFSYIGFSYIGFSDIRFSYVGYSYIRFSDIRFSDIRITESRPVDLYQYVYIKSVEYILCKCYGVIISKSNWFIVTTPPPRGPHGRSTPPIPTHLHVYSW